MTTRRRRRRRPLTLKALDVEIKQLRQQVATAVARTSRINEAVHLDYAGNQDIDQLKRQMADVFAKLARLEQRMAPVQAVASERES